MRIQEKVKGNREKKENKNDEDGNGNDDEKRGIENDSFAIPSLTFKSFLLSFESRDSRLKLQVGSLESRVLSQAIRFSSVEFSETQASEVKQVN